MNIAIIGTGNVGGALATRWAHAGHHIFLGAKDTSNFKGKHLLQNPNTSVSSIAEAVKSAEVILVATPPQIAPELAKIFGEVNGKTIIDATNAISSKPAGYPTAFHAFEALTQAEVVKCFNTTGFENMQNPNYGEVTLDMWMAGDSDQAKQVAHQLALDAGFADCYDFGKTNKVELLEQFALSWINLAIMQGMGRDIGFKLVKRS
jgi:predicted dinucleotide-binding enzyme